MFIFQKARLARIQIAKATSGAAFVAKKRAAEARMAAQVTQIDRQMVKWIDEWIYRVWLGKIYGQIGR